MVITIIEANFKNFRKMVDNSENGGLDMVTNMLTFFIEWKNPSYIVVLFVFPFSSVEHPEVKRRNGNDDGLYDNNFQ